MSEESMESATDQTEASRPEGDSQDSQQHEQQETDWKAEARKWERRAKENANAARERDELKSAQMTEAEKAEARVKAAEDRATQLEAQNARKDVALKHGLSAEDAELLDDLTDPDAMDRLAARLAKQAEADARPRSPRPDPNQGRQGSTAASTADQFAGAIGGMFT